LLRRGSARTRLRGAETAHRIISTAVQGEPNYLAASTRLSPDIAEYPDSGKLAALAELPATGDQQPRLFRFLGRAYPRLDDWGGE